MITLLTIWYEESPEFLYELVSSVAGVCSHVVAVDGAYALYPNARGKSHPDQASAITFACAQHNLGLTLHQPCAPWIGNEVEKRNYALRLARTEWVFVLDGDERLLKSSNLHEQLESTTKDSAVVTHWFSDRGEGSCRKLYRMPVHIGKWHAEYIRHGKEIYTDNNALWLEDVVVEHRKRDPHRQEDAERYYKLRDEKGIEPRA